MLDAYQLNIFLVGAETLNFTETAKRLHMTQPSVSQHVKAIEKNFGCSLFVRKGRHLELTDAGRALVPLASDLVKHSILIEETMESLKGEVYGHLLVGCCTTPGKYILPHILTNFHSIYPQVTISCNVTIQEQAIRMLDNGEIHLILTNKDTSCFTNAESRHFLKDPVVLIAPKNHPWAEKEEISPEEMFESSFIMREPDSGTYGAAQIGMEKIGMNIKDLKSILSLGNSEAIALAVQEGLGVGFVSSLVVEKFCCNRVAPIKVKGLEMWQDIYLGYQTRRPPTAAQIAFWKFSENINPLEFYSED
ncbi:MAG: LysR family transcriptional regulator [Anaerolineaceae bacterium]|nr:LysR family transcriptional regulator [Anaerolineaceae bacterium]